MKQGRDRLPLLAGSLILSAFITLVPAQAQIAGDGTLGTQVNGALTAPCTGTCLITEGAMRGSNLFHSFQQFSLPNATDAAGFVTTPAIQNVIVRVTGVGNPFISNINGTIITIDTAGSLASRNFFLLNPNGIVFGPDARLFNGGSFLATTAERMLFQDGTVFNTRDQTSTPLLTVSVPVGLQMGQTPGGIRSGLRVEAGINSLFNDFALVGGAITLDNSTIRAPGQRVELGGVATVGTVGLNLNGNTLRLNFPNTVPKADVTLANDSAVNVTAGSGGSITINSRNLNLLAGSQLFAGIALDQGSVGAQAGDITLNVTGILNIENSQISNSTSGQGNAGSVVIQAQDAVSLSGSSASIFSNVESGGVGRGGTIAITAGSLSLKEGSQLQTLVRRASGNLLAGQGDAGDVTITVQDSITITGVKDGFPSAIFSNVDLGAIGNGGDITIQADSLSLIDGAEINAGTFGRGNAGNIEINIRGAITMTDSSLIQTSTLGQGNAGKITLQVADSITLTGLSNIRSVVEPGGKGIAGDIDIQSRSLTLTGGSQILASLFRQVNEQPGGVGKAGSISINATDSVNISGVSSVQLPVPFPTIGFSSGLFANAERGSTATEPQAGGNITVTTNNFRIADGAIVDTLTSNSGNAGNITINANTFTASGGGQIVTTTRGAGNAGNIALNVSGDITLAGSDPNFNQRFEQAGNFGPPDDIVNNQGAASGIFANTTFGSTGKGGDIFINSRQTNITDGAQVAVSSTGSGDSGSLTIRSDNLTLNRNALLSATSNSGQGGNIGLDVTGVLLLRHSSNISTTAGLTGSGGDGGNIRINAGFIVAVPKENSDISANAFTGSGGRVDITAQGIYGIQFRPRLTEFSDITASSEFGVQGTVFLNTPDVDPNRGLQPLPVSLVDSSNQIDRRCAAGSGFRRSSFVITGRGGVPLSPDEPLQSETAIADWVTVEEKDESGRMKDESRRTIASSSSPSPIIEVNAWIRDADGIIYLVAATPVEGSLRQFWLTLPGCS